MRLVVVSASVVGGLLLVGALMLLQSVMEGFSPGWTLPFHPLWGAIIAIPGIVMAMAIPMGDRQS